MDTVLCVLRNGAAMGLEVRTVVRPRTSPPTPAPNIAMASNRRAHIRNLCSLHPRGDTSPWDASVGLITGAAATLPPGSPLYLYGPYKRKGFATAPSNEAFDQNLRDRNSTWGLRDLETVTAIAQSVGFSVPTVTEMPANNLSVVFRRM